MVSVLVCSHAANKDIPKTGQFIKEKGLMDSQFHMAGEISQSWWKVKGMSYMAAGKRENERFTHSHENSMGETAPIIQSSPPGPTLDTWGLL